MGNNPPPVHLLQGLSSEGSFSAVGIRRAEAISASLMAAPYRAAPAPRRVYKPSLARRLECETCGLIHSVRIRNCL